MKDSVVIDIRPATLEVTIVEIDHVTIVCNRSFEAVRDALTNDIPPFDPDLVRLLTSANTAEIEKCRVSGPKLWLFETRDHGSLVAAEGSPKKAVQFEIGNPLTAERMTRRHLAAGLYAPLRVILYEDVQQRAIFEYDLPSSLLSQFRDQDVDQTGRELDEELKQVLVAAAG